MSKDEKDDRPSEQQAEPQADDGLTMRRALFTVSDAVLGAAVLLTLGVYGGGWLDEKFHCAPTLSIGLALLGGGLGLARMVIKANSLDTIKGKKLFTSRANATTNSRASKEERALASPEAEATTQVKSQPATNAGPAKEAKIYDTTKQRNPFDDFDD